MPSAGATGRREQTVRAAATIVAMAELWQLYERAIEPIRPWLPLIVGVSVAMSVLGLLMIPVMAVLLPRDYFVRPIRPVPATSQHPVWRWTLYAGRNAVAGVLVPLGVVLMPLPGNGLLIMLAGLMIADFKWKHRWLRRLIRRPAMHQPINALRRRAGRPPVMIPHADDAEAGAPAAVAPRIDAASGEG